ncbi:MAG TPA: sulfurtransferase [Nitrolancea sp.]|nr:sulfurtransferase [Nitrolancea sp.]
MKIARHPSLTTIFRSLATVTLLVFLIGGCRNATRFSGPAGTPSDPNGYPNANLLVSARWLNEHRHDPDLRLVDLSSRGVYADGHIPGAVHLWWQDTIEVHNEVYGMMAGAPEIEKLVASAGITPESHVVLYDDNANRWAARFLWVLNANGFDNVSLLNGGRQAWQESGYDLTKSASTVAAGQLDLTLDYHVLIGADTLAQHLNDPGYVIVDNRTPDEQAENWYGRLRSGQIPGAKLIPWTALTIAGSIPYFADPATLRARFADAGVTPDKTVVVYGLDGVSAASTYVALKLLGYPNVLLYDGSWSEWGANANLPIDPLSQPVSTK